MLPFKLVYSDGYDLNLGAHVFPARKYKLIREKCLAEGIAVPDDFIEPEPAPDEDILRVHTREWTRKLKEGRLNYFEILRLEVPYSPQLVRAFWLSAGGSTLAARRALTDRCAFNFGGGFHHAFADHGEGFCAINDVAVAIRRLQADGAIRTALVVDLDVHQGNGTAAIFAGDPSVYTLSMHQENNYPYPKPPSDLDVNLPDRIGDADYLRLLRDALARAFSEFGARRQGTASSGHDFSRAEPGQIKSRAFRSEVPQGGTSGDLAQREAPEVSPRHDPRSPQPDFIFYLAGADPYREDQLGGLGLTLEGLAERDRIVLETARDRAIPVAVTFAGGYARDTRDTVQIHTNTILAARENFGTTDAHR
jgi:acetoin utilization deacetylase AcuC-like enzyme